MRAYEFAEFGLDNLQLVNRESPTPGPGEVCVDVKALSLNFRDLLVVRGLYNKRLPLPACPLSDGAGSVRSVGDGVTRVRAGDPVVSHFVSDWLEGPFDGRFLATTLGTPGPGLAAEQVILPEHAVLPIPDGIGFDQAATLPIAGLTAFSALVTEGGVKSGDTVLTLGTGGVSIFAVQIAKALGATVIVTSSSDEKLARAQKLGADHMINYRSNPRWEKAVLEVTGGRGVDVVVENGGVQTLSKSLVAVKPGGVVALLGALTGLAGEVDIAPILMKRIRVAGILVDSRSSFESLLRLVGEHNIEPVIDRRFGFEELRDAFECMKAAAHFGKIVVET